MHGGERDRGMGIVGSKSQICAGVGNRGMGEGACRRLVAGHV